MRYILFLTCETNVPDVSVLDEMFRKNGSPHRQVITSHANAYKLFITYAENI